MEIHQYQPGEKKYIDRNIGYVISPATKRVRGGFDTKKKEFDCTLYKNGKKVTIKLF